MFFIQKKKHLATLDEDQRKTQLQNDGDLKRVYLDTGTVLDDNQRARSHSPRPESQPELKSD